MPRWPALLTFAVALVGAAAGIWLTPAGAAAVATAAGVLAALAVAVAAWRSGQEVAAEVAARAEAARAAARDELASERAALLGVLREPVLVFGPDGRLVTANRAAAETLGIDPGEPRTSAQVLGSAQLAEAVTQARATGGAVEVEARLDDRDIAVLAAPVGDEVVAVVRERWRERLVDAVRRDFVANASHQLKTPVAGIQALVDALEVTIGRDPARAADLAGRLRQESERLRRLVHDLLDLQRLEERSPRDAAAVDLARLVRDEVARVADVAAGEGVSVTVDLPDAATVAGTEADLRLVAANLLDNAVRYNRAGGSVVVRLRRADAAWELEVEDTGMGISRSDLGRVFERFYRADAARDRSAGTGLGLSIARHAVERHGGRLRARSVLGEGSTFTAVIPVEPGWR